MKTSIQILSKKPRQQQVTILSEEGNEQAEVVRVTFRELPDAEYESLEAQFRGRLMGFGRFLREAQELEDKLKAELPESDQGKEMELVQKQTARKYNNLLDSLRDIRREIVSKVVVGHKSEDFEFTDLPTPEDSEEVKVEVSAILAAFNATEEEISEAFKVGHWQLPFKAQTWEYESKGEIKSMPGAHPDTVSAYEKFKAGGKLLQSLCNAALSWHKLSLKSAATIKADLMKRRLTLREQGSRVDDMLKLGIVKPEHKEFLLSLDLPDFEQVVALLVGAVSSAVAMLRKEGQKVDPPQALNIINGEVSLNPS